MYPDCQEVFLTSSSLREASSELSCSVILAAPVASQALQSQCLTFIVPTRTRTLLYVLAIVEPFVCGCYAVSLYAPVSAALSLPSASLIAAQCHTPDNEIIPSVS